MARLPGVPRSLVYRIIRTGQVRVNGRRAKPFLKLAVGDQVRVPPVSRTARDKAQVPRAVLDRLAGAIMHEDEHLLVCDKPAGIAVHSGSGISWGLIDALRQLRNDPNLDLVHRLDRDTSGVMVLAKSGEAVRHLQRQFARHRARKRYLALLQGVLPEERLVLRQPLLRRERSGQRQVVVDAAGQDAETRFRELERYGRPPPGSSLVEAEPVTGRTHQIRAHAVFLGSPLAGDARYGTAKSLAVWKELGLRRLFLHAHVLEFDALDEDAPDRDAPHRASGKKGGRSGRRLLFSAPLPDELREVLDRL
jgi:23S rRNA pseudouridine955/2504/2580 synthase